MDREAKNLEFEIERRIYRRLLISFGFLAASLLLIAAAVGFIFFGPKAQADPKAFAEMAEAVSANFVAVSKKVESAVVNIDTKGKIPAPLSKQEEKDLPEDLKEYLRQQQGRAVASVGSGFIVDSRGYILTNEHVVEGSAKITVRLQSGEEYDAKVIGTDEETDLAVLKVEAGSELPTVKFGDSGLIEVGDWVLAIGSPFGLEQTVTAGIISQTRRETPAFRTFQKFIQTDAAINRGNSGGPLVNMLGEVIGVNSQIATQSGEFSGIGFALPSNEASFVFQQILKNGKVKRGYLGVVPDTVKKEFAKVYALGEARGAIIVEIRDPNSPAAKAGLIQNDIITELDGVPVLGAQDLIAKVAQNEPEKQVSITFYREVGDKLEKRSISLKLGERANNSRAAGDEPDTPKKLPINGAKPEALPFGLTLAELTPQNSKALGLEGQKGLIIKDIDQSSFIADLKNSVGGIALNKNDIIQRINRMEVKDLKSFKEIAANLKTGDAVVLHISYINRSGGRSDSLQKKIVQFTIK